MRDEIKKHAARAFFGSAWADLQDESEDGANLSGCEILDVMPDVIDPAAVHAAETLIMDVERANGATIEAILEACSGIPSNYRPCDPEYFGHYLAMDAMGSGVGLEEVTDHKIEVPYVEFGSCSLERDYIAE